MGLELGVSFSFLLFFESKLPCDVAPGRCHDRISIGRFGTKSLTALTNNFLISNQMLIEI